MKRYFATFTCLLLVLTGVSSSIAQQYVMGISTVPGQGSVLMSFNGSIPNLRLISTQKNFPVTPISFSDQDDSLLFYSNGSFIENKYGLKISGSDSLAPPLYYTYGAPCQMGIIALPRGEPTSALFDLFHVDYDSLLQGLWPSRLLHTSINFASNNDTGLCIINSEVVLRDTLVPGFIVSTRHGNGRDFWLVVQKFESNKYFIILNSIEGITIREQVIGSPKLSYLEAGAAAFSPDGTVYARFDHWNGLELLEFDRCSGSFMSVISLPTSLFADTNQFWYNQNHNDPTGLVFSPNSRYLYIVRTNQLYQLDLQLIGQASAIQLVASYDGTRDTTNNQRMLFGTPFLAPNGVIYLYYGGGKWIASIPNPDLTAPACGFNRAALYYPGLGYAGLPQPPNYYLGRLTGSLCDTLEWTGVASGTQTEIVWELSPNPAIHEVLVSLKAGSGVSGGAAAEVYALYSLDGRLLKRVSATNGAATRLWVGDLPAGLYLLQAQQNGYVLGSRRLAVVRD